MGEPQSTRRNPRKSANPKSLSKGIDAIGSVSVIPVFPEEEDSSSDSNSMTETTTASSHPLLASNGDIKSVMAAMLGEPPLNARSPPLQPEEPALAPTPIEIKPESDSDSEDCFIEESKSKVSKQVQQALSTSPQTPVPVSMPLTMPAGAIPVPGGMLVPGVPLNGMAMPILLQPLPNNGMRLVNGVSFGSFSTPSATPSTPKTKITPIKPPRTSAAMSGAEYQKDQFRVCEWMDFTTGAMCGQSFTTMDGIVNHINTAHAAHDMASEQGYACCWRDCERRDLPFKARYKLINHLR